MAKKGSGTGFGVGGSSILVIFILLCLTTFATLSMVSANADLRLTERAADATRDYYDADSRAELILAEIDSYLQEQSLAGLDPEQYAVRSMSGIVDLVPDATVEPLDNNEFMVRYSVAVNDQQQIAVAIRILSGGSAAGRYVREQWQVMSTAEWEPSSDGFTLWGGDDAELGLPSVS